MAQESHSTIAKIQQAVSTVPYCHTLAQFTSIATVQPLAEALSTTNNPFRFMGLPLEIREDVYHAYFNDLQSKDQPLGADSHGGIRLAYWEADIGDFHSKLPALLYVASRQLYEEAIRVYSETHPVILQRASDVKFLPALLSKYSLPTSSLRYVDIRQLFGSCSQDLWYFTDLRGAIGRRDCRDTLPNLQTLMPNLHHVTLDIRQAMLFRKRMWTHLQANDPCKPSPLLESLLQLRNLKCLHVCLPKNVYGGGQCQPLLDYVKEKSKGRVVVEGVKTETWWCEVNTK
jgi:hypothetical protein